MISASDFTSASAFQVLRGMTSQSRVSRTLTASEASRNFPERSSATQRAGRAWRMTGQWNQHDAFIAEQIALAIKFVGRRRLLPFTCEIAGAFGVRCARRLDLPFVNDEARAREQGVAATMIRMQVRANDDIDIVTGEAETGETGHHVIAMRHDGHHDPGKPAPARCRILRYRGMTAGIEKHVALRMAQERAGHRDFHGLAAIGIRKIDALAHAQPATREKMHLHRAVPAFTARIALTMCS